MDEIFVHPGESMGKYRMTAVIDGEVVSHEITQKQYDTSSWRSTTTTA